MSVTAEPRTAAAVADQGPSLRIKVAAVAVLLALAGLAAYTMFSGPTVVPVQGGTQGQKVAPTQVAPPTGEPFEGQEGGDGG